MNGIYVIFDSTTGEPIAYGGSDTEAFEMLQAKHQCGHYDLYFFDKKIFAPTVGHHLTGIVRGLL